MPLPIHSATSIIQTPWVPSASEVSQVKSVPTLKASGSAMHTRTVEHYKHPHAGPCQQLSSNFCSRLRVFLSVLYVLQLATVSHAP